MAEKEYIERNAAHKRLMNNKKWALHPSTMEYAAKLVLTVPAADVVEVVRCKDCIYSKEYTFIEPKGQCMCERQIVRRGIYRSPVMLVVSRDDFCSGGKRKESIDEVT